MFERFTEESRRLVVLAQEEARTLDHDQIGTEHLLLGMVLERDAEVSGVLTRLGIDVVALRAAVLAVIGRGTEPSPAHLHFTRHAKKALELALRESLQIGHRDIRPTHILLGLLRAGEGTAATVLKRQGVNLEDVRVVAAQSSDVGAPAPRQRPRRWVRTRGGDEPSEQQPLLLERFDDEAWEALGRARHGAAQRASGTVESRDVLIAVVSVPGVAAAALHAVGHDAEALGAFDVGEAGAGEPPTVFAFSGPARRAVRWAVDEAQRRDDRAAGTGHLLLALLSHPDDGIERLLDAVGLSHSDLRAEVVERLA